MFLKWFVLAGKAWTVFLGFRQFLLVLWNLLEKTTFTLRMSENKNMASDNERSDLFANEHFCRPTVIVLTFIVKDIKDVLRMLVALLLIFIRRVRVRSQITHHSEGVIQCHSVMWTLSRSDWQLFSKLFKSNHVSVCVGCSLLCPQPHVLPDDSLIRLSWKWCNYSLLQKAFYLRTLSDSLYAGLWTSNGFELGLGSEEQLH